jgi:hypothetical protein
LGPGRVSNAGDRASSVSIPGLYLRRFHASASPQIAEAYANGVVKVTQTALLAEFREGLMTPEERALCVQAWTFNGFYQEQDEVTPVQPDYRLGLFDTIQAQALHGWSDDERRQVEEALERAALAEPNSLIVVAVAKLPPPWPLYDVFDGSVNDLCRKIIEDGFAFESVLAYEEENQDRPEVVAALKQLIVDDVTAPVREVEEVVG